MSAVGAQISQALKALLRDSNFAISDMCRGCHLNFGLLGVLLYCFVNIYVGCIVTLENQTNSVTMASERPKLKKYTSEIAKLESRNTRFNACEIWAPTAHKQKSYRD